MILDLESQDQKERQRSPVRAARGPWLADRRTAALVSWLLLNLALTVYNKVVLGSLPFPWLLTFVHGLSAATGSCLLLVKDRARLTVLGWREHGIMLAFSLLFTLNIAASNISLSMVSVPFHQTVRSTCPVMAVLIERVCFLRRYATLTYLSLIPIVIGVALIAYGEYDFTSPGLALTLLSVALATAKTTVSNRLMTGGLALPALEILARMSPLAAVQALGFAAATGEIRALRLSMLDGRVPPGLALTIAGNALIAFLLNVSSFSTNKLAGALTLTVAGNIKQCLTVLVGIILFDVPVSVSNGTGMLMTLCGAFCYGRAEAASK